jgi:hypothetical protein
MSGCWPPPIEPRFAVGVLNRDSTVWLRSGPRGFGSAPLALRATGVGRPGGDEDPFTAVRRADVAGAKHVPARIEPEVGQVREYGAECPHSRLIWGVSQTPRAGFQVARGLGAGGEDASDVLDHHQAGAEDGYDVGDAAPHAGAGAFGESGTEAGDGEVFGRGSRR